MWITTQANVTICLGPHHCWYIEANNSDPSKLQFNLTLFDSRDGAAMALWTGTEAECRAIKAYFDDQVGAVKLATIRPTSPTP